MIDAKQVAETLHFYTDRGLLHADEAAGLRWLLQGVAPFARHIGAAESIHAHVKVDAIAALPEDAILALGATRTALRDGYVKYVHAGGINLIFSSIPVAEDDRLPEASTPARPFLDHAGIDLREETAPVRALFDAVPELARSQGWRHVAQGGARAVLCCHTQVEAKHWLYPPACHKSWRRPLEFAYGALVVHGASMGCDLRPLDPAHPAAGRAGACCPG